MKILKVISNLLLLFLILPNFICPYHIEDNVSAQTIVSENTNLQDNSFDTMVSFINKLEEENLEKKYSKKELKKIIQFLSFLAKKGELVNDSKDSSFLDEDIKQLWTEIESITNQTSTVSCKQLSRLGSHNHKKKYTHTVKLVSPPRSRLDMLTFGIPIFTLKAAKKIKSFIKKHKKAIIIGAVVVAIVATTACIIIASKSAAAIAASGAIGGAANTQTNSKKKNSYYKEDLRNDSNVIDSYENEIPQENEFVAKDYIDIEQSFDNETNTIEFNQDKNINEEFVEKSIPSLPKEEIFQTIHEPIKEDIAELKEFVSENIPDNLGNLDKKDQNNYINFISEYCHDILDGNGESENPSPLMDYYNSFNDFQENSFYLQGQQALNIHHYDKAINNFQKAIEINPQNYNIYLDRAFAYLNKGEFNNSLSDYKIYTEQKNTKPETSTPIKDYLDFRIGITKGTAQGAFESGKQLILFAAKSITNPIDTISSIDEAFSNLITLAYSKEWKVLSQILAPEACKLIKEWDNLSPKHKGEKLGYVFGKHGADLFCPGMLAKSTLNGIKGAKEFALIAKQLKNTEKVLVLEALAKTGGSSGTFAKTIQTWKTTDKLISASSATLIEGFSIEKLAKAGKVLDRGGVTKAGRSLAKHGGRKSSVFPKPKGNAAQINQHGQKILEMILNDQNKVIFKNQLPKFGNTIDIKIPGKYGVRYYKNGKFIGFLEP